MYAPRIALNANWMKMYFVEMKRAMEMKHVKHAQLIAENVLAEMENAQNLTEKHVKHAKQTVDRVRNVEMKYAMLMRIADLAKMIAENVL